MSLLQLVTFAALLTVIRGQVVGRGCNEAPECGTGAYCDSLKRCRCLFTYISSGGFCLRKINPDESGCSSDLQCNSVWPGARCSSGTCRCGNNQPAFPSRDGPVCLTYGFCPINSNYKLRENNVARTCQFGIDASCNTPTYECVCNQQDCLNPPGATTFCCPTRAFACHEPQDSGSGGGGGGTRYYFNSASGSCQPFSYSGAGGNANNFQNQEQCESYCLTGCTRGQPLYAAAVAPSVKETIRSCTSTGTGLTSCGANDYSCENTGRGLYCCPTANQVCCTNCNAGNRGGVQYNNQLTPPNTPYDAGIASGNGRTYQRFYYDSAQGQCRTFTYNGQGGNFNNFLSQGECDSFCAKSLCDAGTPLKDGSGNNQQCNPGVCPSTHTCNTRVCCPTKQTVCGAPLVSGGPCNTFSDRYWYNSATGNCQQFRYTGCQGNDNNFANYQDCQNFCAGAGAEPQCPQGRAARDSSGNYINCASSGVANLALCPGGGRDYTCLFDGTRYGCCPTQTNICSQTNDPGTSCVTTASISRWYYNSQSRQCATFPYGGCDGNDNNFATQQDCLDYCQTGGCPNGGEPYRTTGINFVCGTQACPTGYLCSTVSLGSLTQTFQYCCPTRNYICRLPRNQGVQCGVGTLTRYYFDPNSRQCVSFPFFGCQGNRNNFGTLTQCRNYCYSADCPEGQVSLVDTTTGSIQQCSSNACPTSYTCTTSSLMGQQLCCGSPAPAGSCPASRPNAYIDPFTTTVMNCVANVPATCPANNICSFSGTTNNFYCCGFGANVCPNGGSPFINGATNLALECVIGTPNNCAAAGGTYTCQARSQNIGGVQSTLGTCCSPGAVDVCGAGYTATLLNGSPARCNPTTANVCPTPATCRAAPGTTNSYYCCTLTGTTVAPLAVCNGQQQYVVNGNPVVCNNGLASTNCPSPYSCILYTPTNVFYCCGGQGGGAGVCPGGYSVSQVNGVVQRCSPSSAGSCGGSNLCQFVSQYNGYVCCVTGGTVPVPGPGPVPSSDAYCNVGRVYLYQGTTLPLACTIGGPPCPSGYNCSPSKNGQGNVCCTVSFTTGGSTTGTGTNTGSTGGAGGCPASTPTAYLFPGTTSPLDCTNNRSGCPTGYQCAQSTSFSGFQCCQ